MHFNNAMQTAFTCLITLQLLVVALHDLVDIPGWTHGGQVQALIGRRKLWAATLINSVFPGLAVAFAFSYLSKPKPHFVFNYWLIYCAITVASAIAMWYVPYFLGASEKTKRDYLMMYAGTRQVLPPRGDNPRPNLLHICFHGLFVVTFILAVILRLRSA